MCCNNLENVYSIRKVARYFSDNVLKRARGVYKNYQQLQTSKNGKHMVESNLSVIKVYTGKSRFVSMS